MSTPVEQQFAALTEAYEYALREYGRHSRVNGIDIGFREDNPEKLAVRLHLASPEEAQWRLAMRGSAGPIVIAPKFAPDVVKLKATYFAHTLADVGTSSNAAAGATLSRSARADKLQPGIEIAHRRRAGGTLGLIVVDRETNKLCVLSAAHVLRGPDDKRTNILQPTFRNGGRDDDATVAHYLRAVDAPFGDAAIGAIENRDCSDVQFRTNVIVKKAVPVQIGDLVEKSGVGTEITTGVVDGIGRYCMSPTDIDGVDGFRIVPGEGDRTDISDFGDSGAVWYLKENGVGVGIHMGGVGSDVKTRPAIACHLLTVLERLKVDIWTAEQARP